LFAGSISEQVPRSRDSADARTSGQAALRWAVLRLAILREYADVPEVNWSKIVWALEERGWTDGTELKPLRAFFYLFFFFLVTFTKAGEPRSGAAAATPTTSTSISWLPTASHPLSP
jgi:hypothetical protein